MLILLDSITAWRRKQPWQQTPERKRGTLTRRTSCDPRLEEVVTSRTKLLQYWSRGTCNRLCDRKIETIPTRKTVHFTDWPQTSQIFLRPRRINSENCISNIYKMGNSADGIWLRIEIYNREQIPHADALNRLDFDKDDDNDRVCFALDNIYFVQSDLVTQSDIKIELGSNRLFQDVIKRIKSGIWKQCSEAEKEYEQQKDALTIHNGIIFRGVVPFIPPKLRPMVKAKAHETHPGKNSIKTAVRMMAWWPVISQDVLQYVSKCKECQEKRPSLGKTVSTWPEAEVWERLHMEWSYVRDQGNILMIVDAGSGWIKAFPAGNSTSQTVKVHLSQIFARFWIPRTLV